MIHKTERRINPLKIETERRLASIPSKTERRSASPAAAPLRNRFRTSECIVLEAVKVNTMQRNVRKRLLHFAPVKRSVSPPRPSPPS